MPKAGSKPPVISIFFGVLFLAAALLGVQLPFLYYSDDIVFHAAKIMAAKGGDYFTDPVTGFASLYPPLYHIIVGKAAAVFDWSSFLTSRVVQVVQFLGLFLSAFFLFTRTLRTREQAAVGGLLLILLMYAPTGRYWLLGNPFNFSVMFVLTGVALVVDWFRTGALGRGIVGAVIAGVGINLWWWNLFPVAGVGIGIVAMLAARHEWRRRRGSVAAVVGALMLVLAWNLWPVWEVREVLPNYQAAGGQTTFAAEHGTTGTLAKWATGFLLKGNEQFFKYLYPEALGSDNKLVVVYGLFASVYYYLLVLPFNLLFLIGGVWESIRRWFEGARDRLPALLIAAVVTFGLSLATLFLTNSSITRRVQFYCFVFLVPAFVMFLWERLRFDKRAGRQWALVVVCSGAIIYNVIYRFDITLTDPVSAETSEVAAYVSSLPDHAERRIFVTEHDNHLLLREAQYRSFLLRGNPSYFQQDRPQADSIEQAYRAIVEAGPDAENWLREFGTELAVIRKTGANISPIMNEERVDPVSERMLGYFRQYGEVALENNEWAVFHLRYPFKSHSGEADSAQANSGG